MAVKPLNSTVTNALGKSTWTQTPTGSKQTTTLTPMNSGVYSNATQSLNRGLDGMQGMKAPSMITDAGGLYSDKLAGTIFDRTWGMQTNDINERESALQARMAEQGFAPQNQGYVNEMNRWEDNLGNMRQGVAQDAQIQAAKQALAEATFTNDARQQEFSNQFGLNQGLITTGQGVRKDIDAGMAAFNTPQQMAANYDLGREQNANQSQQIANNFALGSQANLIDAVNGDRTAGANADALRNQSRNDLIRAMLQWGVG